MDVLIGTVGHDTLNVSSASGGYEVQGLAGNDTITGSNFDDLIIGGAGRDTMYGNGGDDSFVITGSDVDTVYDTVNGGAGYDRILGDAGDDVFRFYNFTGANTVELIDGGGGVNIIAAPMGSGSTLDFSGTMLVNIDRIVGGSLINIITGSSGDDVIVGGPGKDTLKGGDGNDTFILAGVDAETVYDTVSGGAGVDRILGGAGDDVFRFHIFSGENTVERIDGGEGTNIIAAHSTSASSLDFSGTVLLGISQIVGGSGRDKITGSAGDDRISGGGGDDTLIGGLGHDTALYGGVYASYTITALAGGQWRVATSANAEGSDTLSGFETLEFVDGTYSFATGVFTPLGGSLNTPPVAQADAYAGTEDQPVTVDAAAGVLANDSDADGDGLSVVAYDASSVRGGAVVMNPNGSFSYTPAANVNGADSFYYTISDGQGGVATATVALNLAPVADAPQALNDTYTATADTVLMVEAAPGVLANDIDPDGDALSVSAYSENSAQGGSVVMNPDGSFSYTPLAGYTGPDSFTYAAFDGSTATQASVSITVSPPGSGLTLLIGTVGHDTLNVSSASGGYEVQGLAGNDTITGSNFDDLIIGGAGRDTMYGNGGDDSFVITGSDVDTVYDTVNGGAGYDRILGDAGDDVFRFYNFTGANTVELIDGGGGVNIIAAPMGSGSTLDFSGTMLVNIDRIVGGSLINIITGSSGDDVIVGGPGKDTLKGGDGNDTFILAGVDAETVYDTVSGGAGVDRILGGAGDDVFRFHIFSGENTVERIDGGEGTNIIAAHSTSASSLDFSGTVLLGISQIVGGSGRDKITGSAGDDRISGGGGDDTLIGGLGHDTALYGGVYASYTITALAGGQWRVATSANAEGSDTLSGFETLEFVDGTYSFATGVFTPLGGSLNTPPVAQADAYAGTEDQPVTVDAAAGVLANDSDADGDGLSVVAYDASSVRGGAVVMNPNGSFSYTPAANVNGADSFYYTISDGQGGVATATVALNLAPVADAPQALNDTYTATADTVLMVEAAPGVLANDIDPDGDALSVSAYSENSAQGGSVVMNPDGSFSYTPLAGYTGPDSFTYAAFDGSTATQASVSITVSPPGSGLTLLIGTVGHDTLNVSSASGGYEVQGLAGNDTITGSNFDDLIIGGAGRDTMYGNGGDDSFVITGSDVDTVYDTVNGGAGYDRILGDAGDDVFRFYNFTGANTVELIDGGGGVNIIVAPMGSGSTLDFSGTMLVNIDRIVGGSLINIITGSSGDDVIVGGPGKDTLKGGDGNDTFILAGVDAETVYDTVSGGAGVDRILGGAGDDVFRFYNFTGAYTVERIDGGEGTNIIAAHSTSASSLDFSGTVLLGISQIVGGSGRDKITGSAGDDRISGGGGDDTLIGGLGHDTALYGGVYASYTITALGGGQWRVATSANAEGSDTLSGFETLEFVDGTYSIATGVFTPLGSSLNTPPVAQADAYAGTEDQPVTVDAAAGVLANDSDADGDGLSVVAYDASSVRGGAVVMNPNGSFSYTPAANVNGADSFYYTISDGQGGVATATVTLNLAPVADAPQALNDTYTATADTVLTVAARAGVLANDIDPDGDALSVSAYSENSAQGGSVVMNPDGSFSYTPLAGYTGPDSLTYAAFDGSTATQASVSITVGVHAPMTAFQSIIMNLPEGEWVRLNANPFSDVWAPAEQRPHEQITGSPASIIHAWGSGTWDTTRDKYIIWGGGHANYEGNEVYMWNANTLLWERGSLPSAVTLMGPSRYETVDGYLHSPIASHTWDNTEFLELADRMITFGGAAAHTGQWFVKSDGVTLTGPYLWDPSKADPNAVGGLAGSQVDPQNFPNVTGGEMWENRDTWNSGAAVPNYMANQTTDYAQIDGKDVVFITGANGLFKYTLADIGNPSLDTWEQLGVFSNPFVGSGAGAYSPDQNIYVRTSASSFTYWDLDSAGSFNPNVNFLPSDPTGEFVLSKDFGMEYDPVRQQFVLWEGDETIWFLRPPEEPSAAGWELVKAPEVQYPSPAQPETFTGVLGKWDYVERYDVFIGLTESVSGDIWAYKPIDWTPSDDWFA